MTTPILHLIILKGLLTKAVKIGERSNLMFLWALQQLFSKSSPLCVFLISWRKNAGAVNLHEFT